MICFVKDREIYEQVIRDRVPLARRRLWIATADIKDMYVDSGGNKCVIVDGTFAWFGSANLTGAGMGAKSDRKRNFENGVVTDDPALIAPLEDQFDAIWRGDFCKDCGRKDFCGDPIKDS